MTSLEGWSSTIELRPQRPHQGAADPPSVPSPARPDIHQAGASQAGASQAGASQAGASQAGTSQAPQAKRTERPLRHGGVITIKRGPDETLIGAPATFVAVEIGVTVFDPELVT
jgi:hypothetical protein